MISGAAVARLRVDGGRTHRASGIRAGGQPRGWESSAAEMAASAAGHAPRLGDPRRRAAVQRRWR